MKTHTRRQQHKNIKHQDIKQKEPPQKYRLGTISNKKLLAGLCTRKDFLQGIENRVVLQR